MASDATFGRVDFKRPRHRYILSLCYQMGWTKMNDQLGRMVVDNERLGRWIREYSKCKKPIMKHSEEELGTLILAMENMLQNRMSR
ncbi:MAG: hypothetical protein ACRDDZ_11230 [Marinifilaceae bacterium]